MSYSRSEQPSVLSSYQLKILSTNSTTKAVLRGRPLSAVQSIPPDLPTMPQVIAIDDNTLQAISSMQATQEQMAIELRQQASDIRFLLIRQQDDDDVKQRLESQLRDMTEERNTYRDTNLDLQTRMQDRKERLHQGRA